jgi:DNA-directed RNA polymerase specialized sigma24 family protein
VLLNDFWAQIEEALEPMETDPWTLFVGHYRYGAGIAELASEFGRTEEAVKQCLARVRKRLRRRLEETGRTEAALRDYL